MQTPWNQHNQTLQSWIHQELHALVKQVEGSASLSSRRLYAVTFVHQLFLSKVVLYPELWSMRRDFYSKASCVMVEIWKELEANHASGIFCFACLPEETSQWIRSVESYCAQNPWKADLARLKILMGMGEVEISEILDIPERSIHRQVASLPKMGASSSVEMASS